MRTCFKIWRAKHRRYGRAWSSKYEYVYICTATDAGVPDWLCAFRAEHKDDPAHIARVAADYVRQFAGINDPADHEACLQRKCAERLCLMKREEAVDAAEPLGALRTA